LFSCLLLLPGHAEAGRGSCARGRARLERYAHTAARALADFGKAADAATVRAVAAALPAAASERLRRCLARPAAAPVELAAKRARTEPPQLTADGGGHGSY
jgi:hypothetical protein